MTALAIFNQKGGVGKTTTALNLAAALVRRGERPLLIDLDSQAHLTQILQPQTSAADSVFGFYGQSKPLATLTRTVALAKGEADFIGAHAELAKVDSLFGKGPRILYRLKQGIEELVRAGPAALAGRPIIIDCCPMLGVLSLGGVFAVDKLIIPVSADYLAVRGGHALERTLNAIQPVLKRRVERRYVLTRFDARRKMAHEIERGLRDRFGTEVCRTRIHETVALAESPYHGKDVFAHDGSARGATDYATLLDELLGEEFLGRLMSNPASVASQMVASAAAPGRERLVAHPPSLAEGPVFATA